jgi:transposase
MLAAARTGPVRICRAAPGIHTVIQPRVQPYIVLKLGEGQARRTPLRYALELASKGLQRAVKENPHLEFYRMPSYSPQLNVIERFWKKLRRRATHNRLFDEIADLKSSVRNSLRYFQTVRGRLLALINGRPKKSKQ